MEIYYNNYHKNSELQQIRLNKVILNKLSCGKDLCISKKDYDLLLELKECKPIIKLRFIIIKPLAVLINY